MSECRSNTPRLISNIAKLIVRYPNGPETPKIGDLNDDSLIKRLENYFNSNDIPRPLFEQSFQDIWDSKHVRMPCSLSNQNRENAPIWNSQAHALVMLMGKCRNFETMDVQEIGIFLNFICGYNCEIDGLSDVINRNFTKQERMKFFSVTLPYMCQLALNVGALCGKSPSLLLEGRSASVTMSQMQAASLLACAFFCLFPGRSRPTKKPEYENFQNPNFNNFFRRGTPKKLTKLHCILNYFQRVAERMPTGVLTIQRLVLESSSRPEWNKSQKKLVPIHITSEKKIEDVPNTLQVDFANAFIGGGVLREGCVQEEIRFSICPEMLISLILCERMKENECIRFIGFERFSNYRGYNDNFSFDGNHLDQTLRDRSLRRWSRVVAIDAVPYEKPELQCQWKNIERELNKAFVGFHVESIGENQYFPVTTGHWGCGAFNGNPQIKAIVQLIAASEAQRPMIYAVYQDETFAKQFREIYESLIARDFNVEKLYSALRNFARKKIQIPLFNFLKTC